jgi:hypothetical protein
VDYCAIVVAILAADVSGRTLDGLAVVLLSARICQTVIHVGFKESNAATAWRFAFFFTQLLCMGGMSIIVIRAVL